MGTIRSIRRAQGRASSAKQKPKGAIRLLATPGNHPFFSLAEKILSGKSPAASAKPLPPKKFASVPVGKTSQFFSPKAHVRSRGTTSTKPAFVRPNAPRSPGSKSRVTGTKKR